MPDALHLSPSEYHRHVMSRIKPALAFDGGDVAAWQERLRAKLRELIGVLPDPAARPPLNVRTLWRWEDHLGLGSVEKIAFAAEPFADVVAYWCVPHDVKPPYPTFICLQGHSSGMHNSIGVQKEDETQLKAIEGDRDFALGCMKRGIAALCIEQRSFGERVEKVQERRSEQMCQDAAAQALLTGRTLAGERVGDVDRGIDYLAARGDVDMSRLGVMGNSGGGTITIYASALLPRVTHAMPSCSFCTYVDSIGSIHHCIDNYIPGILPQAEMADVLGLFAPKPVVVVTGARDPIFPLAGVQKAYADLERIYAAAGAGEKCRLVIGDGEHRFYADAGWAAMGPMFL